MQDRALVRAMSSALVNRVTILHLRVDTDEWLAWAARNGIRREIRSFIANMPDALMRPVPAEPVPFSTPRAWALLSRALDMAEASGILSNETRRALAFGRLSAEDAAVFCALAEEAIGPVRPLEDYIRAARAAAARRTPRAGSSSTASASTCATARLARFKPRVINRFLRSLSPEHQLTVLTDWSSNGARSAPTARCSTC